ncbi:hypothetical protein COLO4_18189 [Corchorus olitorius]|uniref:CASP-like protein n=1 Tax=Corchorus olitorius TaxID=93759 RepID=A0A1R3JA17_9ROSI|nr:hypothetical protein COLO4_18189 [Corchorus olitorius]
MAAEVASSLIFRIARGLAAVVAMVMASFNAATMGIFYLEKKGNTHAFWDPICDIVQTYCLRLTVAVSFGYAALIIYILIVIYWICVTLNILLIEPPKKAAPPSAPPKP